MLTPRSVALLVAAGAATAALAGCASQPPAAAPASSAATQPSGPATSVPATSAPPSATSPVAAAPAKAATPTPAAPPPNTPLPATTPMNAAGNCATTAGAGLPNASITVCPVRGPVGTVVHVTIKGCAPSGAGLPALPAADLHFLGPNSWLGTNGGGGANVSFAPRTGSAATATFTIPATYTGGNEHGPYPKLTVKPGSGYSFVTDPAGSCHVPFTVTAR